MVGRNVLSFGWDFLCGFWVFFWDFFGFGGLVIFWGVGEFWGLDEGGRGLRGWRGVWVVREPISRTFWRNY